MDYTTTELSRFWSKVDTSGDCWLWTAGVSDVGYGAFWQDKQMQKAHRISYTLANGPIPSAHEVDHLCFNRGCVNPSHLRLATRGENMQHRQGANANSSSGVRGVYFRKDTGKWQVRLMHNGKNVIVGCFSNKDDAEAAAIAKRNEVFTHNALDRMAA